MENKEKLNVGKEVVNVNTTVKKVVTIPKKEEKITKEASSLQKTLDEHLEETEKSVKLAIDYKSLAMYLILIAIIAGVIFLLVHFFYKYNDGQI